MFYCKKMAGNSSEDEVDALSNLMVEDIALGSDSPNSKHFDGIFGLDRTRHMLEKSIVLSFLSQETLKSHAKKAIFLYGAPGSGKTTLIRETAKASKAKLLMFSAWNFNSRKSRDSVEDNLKALFNTLRINYPCILYIEDIEVLEKNTYPFITAKMCFINEMKRYLQEDTIHLAVIATAQKPWEVDPCLIKLFSVSSSSHVTLPDHKARTSLLEYLCSSTVNSLRQDDFETLASKTDGFSGADLSCIVRGASMEPLRILSKATHFKKIFSRPVTVDKTLEDKPGASQEIAVFGESSIVSSIMTPSKYSEQDSMDKHVQESVDLGVKAATETDMSTNLDTLTAFNNPLSIDEDGANNMREEKFTPCEADDIDAIPMSMFDIPEEKIELPILTMQHMVQELSATRRTITVDELQRLSYFESHFCP